MKNRKLNQKQLRKFLRSIILSTCVIFILPFEVSSKKPANINNEITVGEQIQLLTDRNLYIVQERVFFNVIYSCTEKLKDIEWSKVIYLELLNEEGQVKLQQKLPVNKNGSFGSFEIPTELQTGYYYLRAYTKWMINFGPNVFPYSRLTIVNPYNDQINSGNNNSPTETVNLKTGSNFQVAESFSVKTDKNQYGQREKVSLKLIFDKIEPNGDFTVSIVKTNTLDNKYMAGNVDASGKLLPVSIENVTHLPENRGLNFSGKMNSGDNMIDNKKKLVNLSIIGDSPYFAQTYTNSEGEFYFTLPKQEGELNLFLCPEGNTDADISFIVNNDFANFHYPIKSTEFQLTDEQRILARDLAINSQIIKTYPKSGITEIDTLSSDSSKIYFYGKPKHHLYLDQYIVLPNLGEVIFELVPDVLLLKKNKTSYIRVENDNYWSSSNPLVLLDHVPIYDLSTILGINSQKFESIDVINTIYLKGGMVYPGIISIFSRNNDIAGAELPKGGAFFSYKSYTKQELTVEDGNTQNKENIPDLRNCLYWNPNLSISNKETEIEFSTSDCKGEYTVLIRKGNGFGEKIELSTCSFTVE